MSLTWIANTNQGRMVGDYISTSFTGDGKAHPVFAIGQAADRQRVRGARGERDLRPDRSAGLSASPRGQRTRLSRPRQARQFEHSPFPLEESRAKG